MVGHVIESFDARFLEDLIAYQTRSYPGELITFCLKLIFTFKKEKILENC